MVSNSKAEVKHRAKRKPKRYARFPGNVPCGFEMGCFPDATKFRVAHGAPFFGVRKFDNVLLHSRIV
jgi:hypothetical protein